MWEQHTGYDPGHLLSLSDTYSGFRPFVPASAHIITAYGDCHAGYDSLWNYIFYCLLCNRKTKEQKLKYLLKLSLALGVQRRYNGVIDIIKSKGKAGL